MSDIFDSISLVGEQVAELEEQRKTNPTAFAGQRVKGTFSGSRNVTAMKARDQLKALAARFDKVVVT